MDRQPRQAGSEEACQRLAWLQAEIGRLQRELAIEGIPELLQRLTRARQELNAVACALVRDQLLAAVAGRPSLLNAPGDAIDMLGRFAGRRV